MAVEYLKGAEPYVIIDNFFQFRFVLNPGAAFGFLAATEEGFRQPFFLSVTSLAIVFIGYMLLAMKEETILMKLSLCLILSGAIGNLIDRIRIKAVIDFIDVIYYNGAHWPAFNIADSVITVGVVLMGLDIIFKHKNEKGITDAPDSI